MDLTNINHLVLSGGGILGYSYIGMLKYMEEINIISKIKYITGCSAGAIFGTLIAFGFTSDELYTALININPSEYFEITLDSIIALPAQKGLDTGDKFINKIKELIGVKTLNPEITFLELYNKTGIKLNLGISNIINMKFELCNYETTPDIPIHLALRASIAIPFIIKPVQIGEWWYCDGGLCNNYPIDIMLNNTEILGIYLTNSINVENINSIENITIGEYIDKIMKCCTNIMQIIEKHRNNTIIIEIPREITFSFNFMTSKENIIKCVFYGYKMIKLQIEKNQNI